MRRRDRRGSASKERTWSLRRHLCIYFVFPLFFICMCSSPSRFPWFSPLLRLAFFFCCCCCCFFWCCCLLFGVLRFGSSFFLSFFLLISCSCVTSSRSLDPRQNRRRFSASLSIFAWVGAACICLPTTRRYDQVGAVWLYLIWLGCLTPLLLLLFFPPLKYKKGGCRWAQSLRRQISTWTRTGHTLTTLPPRPLTVR